MTKADVLIVGGGISGISAAVELAETGLDVVLVEKLPYLGGRVIRMNQYFPKLCPPFCGLEINFRRMRHLPNLRVHTEALVTGIGGQEGAYRITVRQSARYVNDRCTACGECSKVCPQEGPDDFNYGMNARKAIALPHEMAIPLRYSIDPDSCLFGDCGKCTEACSYGAIDLAAQASEFTLEVSSVIFATGWKPYDPMLLPEFTSGPAGRVISNVMMERMAAPGGPTGGKIPAKKIAFIQCAGSRDINHQPWCSAVCCSASLKHALSFVEQDKEARAVIFYIDLRVTGRNEDFLRRVEEHPQVQLIKGKVAAVTTDSSSGLPVLKAEDIMGGRIIEEAFDLVVLATGISPESPGPALEDFQYRNPEILNSTEVPGRTIDQSHAANQNQTASHPKTTDQIQTGNHAGQAISGLILAGCARKPMDVSSCVKDAGRAALKALQACHNNGNQ